MSRQRTRETAPARASNRKRRRAVPEKAAAKAPVRAKQLEEQRSVFEEHQRSNGIIPFSAWEKNASKIVATVRKAKSEAERTHSVSERR